MVKVREYRLMARLSQSELAKRAGIDDRTVKRCEDGQTIQDVTSAAIADAVSQALQQTHRPSPDNAIYLTAQHNRAMLARQRTTTQEPAVADVEEDEQFYPTRLPTSARRYPIQPGQVITHGNKRFVIHEPVPVQ